MTLQQLITSVSNNLGDRASGTIGSETVDSVVLFGANQALPQVVKLANPEYYDRTVVLNVPAGSPQEIAVPTTDINGVAHSVKDIVHYRVSRAAEGTPVTIVRKTWYEFMKVTSDYDQGLTGIPSFMAFREGNLYLNRIPEEEYNITFYVEVWPVQLTSSDKEKPLPIGSQWELAVEAFTTYYCYMKLQQVALSEYWKALYEDQKSVNSQQTRKLDSRGQGDDSGLVMSGRPWLDPFIRQYN